MRLTCIICITFVNAKHTDTQTKLLVHTVQLVCVTYPWTSFLAPRKGGERGHDASNRLNFST